MQINEIFFDEKSCIFQKNVVPLQRFLNMGYDQT